MEPRVKRLILSVGIIAVLGGIITAWINIYPDLLWFKMLNYLSIYTEILYTKILVGVIVGLTYLVILLINLFIVYKYTPAQLSPAFLGGTEFTGGETNTRKMIYGGLTIMAVLFSVLMGYSATDRWEIYLRYTHAGQLDFQAATPITVNDGFDSDTISVSTLELQANKVQIGDEIKVFVDENEPVIATVNQIISEQREQNNKILLKCQKRLKK